MLKVEHIGIAVHSLAQAIPLFQNILKTPCYKQETVESEGVTTAFFKTGDAKIELLEPTGEHGVLKKFLDKRGEGLHHIAFEVADIEAEMARLQGEGFTVLNTTPKRGADNKRVCFLHPKDTAGVLIELCEELKNPGRDRG
jgi:methylmalonyl-CoA/ethylmalonyl-CoA epimerase